MNKPATPVDPHKRQTCSLDCARAGELLEIVTVDDSTHESKPSDSACPRERASNA